MLFDFLLLPDGFNVAILPVGLPQLDRSGAYIFAIHFSHGLGEIRGISKTDESVAFRLVALLVSNDLGFDERGISTEEKKISLYTCELLNPI